MLSLMDALYPILPGALFFIEGSDQDCEFGSLHIACPTLTDA